MFGKTRIRNMMSLILALVMISGLLPSMTARAEEGDGLITIDFNVQENNSRTDASMAAGTELTVKDASGAVVHTFTLESSSHTEFEGSEGSYTFEVNPAQVEGYDVEMSGDGDAEVVFEADPSTGGVAGNHAITLNYIPNTNNAKYTDQGTLVITIDSYYETEDGGRKTISPEKLEGSRIELKNRETGLTITIRHDGEAKTYLDSIKAGSYNVTITPAEIEGYEGVSNSDGPCDIDRFEIKEDGSYAGVWFTVVYTKKDETPADDSATEESVEDESKAEESSEEESSTEESSAEESKAEESSAEESKTEESKAEESSAEESKAEESSADQNARGNITFGVEARVYDKETAVTRPDQSPYSSLSPSLFAGTVLTVKNSYGNLVGTVTVDYEKSSRVFYDLPSGDYVLGVKVVADDSVKAYPVSFEGDGLVHVKVADTEGDGNYYASATVTITFTKPYVIDESKREEASRAEESRAEESRAEESRRDESSRPENTQPQRETNLSEDQPPTGDINILWIVIAGLALIAITVSARKASET